MINLKCLLLFSNGNLLTAECDFSFTIFRGECYSTSKFFKREGPAPSTIEYII